MLAVYADPTLSAYGFGADHPFGNDRLGAFWTEALRRGIDKRVALPPARDATDSELLRFHDADFLKRMRSMSDIGFGYLDCGDTPAQQGIFDAARRVAGTSLDAVETVMRGKHPRAFLPIAGLHHGRRQAAAGFCVVNDCGIVIETLKHQYGLTRIAYIDIDAHHGDGVYYEFESDPAVIVADIHEDGRFLYPGTGDNDERGSGEAMGCKLNLPMAPGSDDRAFDQAWPRVIEHLESFRPEFIILQAGADSIRGDPLTHLEFTPRAHREACASLCRLAKRFADGRIVVMGGGGYNRDNIAQTWCEVIEALLEE
jgi:acetoin utilization protein AcuC